MSTRTYLVVGATRVAGKRPGQIVTLDAEHGDRLVRSGHLEPQTHDPTPDSDPTPDPDPEE